MKKVSPPSSPSFSFSHALHALLTFEGRLNRRPFLIRYGAYWLASQVLAMLCLSGMTETQKALMFNPEFNPTKYGDMPPPLVHAQAIISIAFLLMLPSVVRRLKDMNLHPFAAIAAYATSLEFYIFWRFDLDIQPQLSITATFVSFLFILFLLVKRGTVGTNFYGPDPVERRA